MATSQSGLHFCGLCPFRSATKSSILKHLKESHSQDPGFHLRCLLCSRSFTVFSSFTSHVSRSHPGTLVENAYDNEISNDQLSEDSVTDTGDVPIELAELQTTTAMSDENTAAADVTAHDVALSAGKFLVGLKEKHLVRS